MEGSDKNDSTSPFGFSCPYLSFVSIIIAPLFYSQGKEMFTSSIAP